jgi:hypothetical protein
MKIQILKKIFILLILAVATAGIWIHSFEHVESHSAENCKLVVHANVSASEVPAVLVSPIIIALAITATITQPILQAHSFLKHPFKNKAPPLFV